MAPKKYPCVCPAACILHPPGTKGGQRKSPPRGKDPWFPAGPDRDHLESVLMALAAAMAFSGTEGIVQDYLDGKSILTRVGQRGVWHFNHMTRTLGMRPPEGT